MSRITFNMAYYLKCLLCLKKPSIVLSTGYHRNRPSDAKISFSLAYCLNRFITAKKSSLVFSSAYDCNRLFPCQKIKSSRRKLWIVFGRIQCIVFGLISSCRKFPALVRRLLHTGAAESAAHCAEKVAAAVWAKRLQRYSCAGV